MSSQRISLPLSAAGRAAALCLLWSLAFVCFAANAQDSGNIVYHDAASSSLKRTNTLGSFSQSLTHPPAGYTDESASWSPTGRSVVFERRQGARDETYDGQDRQIVVVDRLGRRERVIATGFAPVWSGWSPNRIAFVGWPYMNIPELQCVYTIHHDGTGLQLLSCVEQLGPTMPWCTTGVHTCYQKYRKLAWSRDGRYVIAHVATFVINHADPTDQFWMYTLWRTRVSDRAQARVPNSPDAIDPIDFSMAAGNTLYYGTLEQPEAGVDIPVIHRVNFITGAGARVAEGSLPIVSPDATGLAFTAPQGANRHGRLYYANADGSGARLLAGPTTTARVAPLDWSRDGSHILLQRSEAELNSLHLVTLTGAWRTVRRNAVAEAGAWHQAPP